MEQILRKVLGVCIKRDIEISFLINERLKNFIIFCNKKKKKFLDSYTKIFKGINSTNDNIEFFLRNNNSYLEDQESRLLKQLDNIWNEFEDAEKNAINRVFKVYDDGMAKLSNFLKSLQKNLINPRNKIVLR